MNFPIKPYRRKRTLQRIPKVSHSGFYIYLYSYWYYWALFFLKFKLLLSILLFQSEGLPLAFLIGLLVMNTLLSWNILISLSVLKDNFARQITPSWQFVCVCVCVVFLRGAGVKMEGVGLQIWLVSDHIVLDEKSALNITEDLLYITSSLSLLLSKASPCLWIWQFYYMSWFLSLLSLWCLEIIYLLGFVYLCLSLYLGDGKTLFLQTFFCCLLSSIYDTPIIYVYIFKFDGVSQVLQTLFIFFIFFPFSSSELYKFNCFSFKFTNLLFHLI